MKPLEPSAVRMRSVNVSALVVCFTMDWKLLPSPAPTTSSKAVTTASKVRWLVNS
ncbi:MAG: hypothetical protein WAM66_00610 [Acidobacteriaceae bacterium]